MQLRYSLTPTDPSKKFIINQVSYRLIELRIIASKLVLRTENHKKLLLTELAEHIPPILTCQICLI
jgi:hypothetical protein